MSCRSDQDCPFLYACSVQNSCQHDPVTDFSLYTVIVYLLLIPFACGLVNITGNSMGIFKVLIVMNILRYNSNQATVVAQCLVVGSAIPNFFSIIFRRHPVLETSLVNFNLVYVLIPCCLLGSTFGALVQDFIPQIFQDLLIIIVFSYFSTTFFKKFQKARQLQKQQLLLKSLIIMSQKQAQQQLQFQADRKNSNKSLTSEKHQNSQNVSIQKAQIDLQQNLQNHIQSYKRQKKEQFEQMKKYEKSIHLADILISFCVFMIFQLVVVLAQGKLSFFKFDHCDYKYFIGIAFLVAITAAYLKLINRFLTKRFLQYKKFGFSQQIDLSKRKQFLFIALGGFGAGFTQGVLGVGSGTVVMAALLYFPISPRSASATSGFQILFIGLASLVQGFINGQVDITDSLLFIVDSTILGGIVTLLITYYLKNKDISKVATILLFVIFTLCLMSVIMVIPSGITSYLDFGWDSMIQIKFHC